MELLESENAVEAEKGEGEIVVEFEDELEANKLGNEGAALDEPATVAPLNKGRAGVPAAGVEKKGDAFKVELVGAADEDETKKGEDAAADGVVPTRGVVALGVELELAANRGVVVVAGEIAAADGVAQNRGVVELAVDEGAPNRGREAVAADDDVPNRDMVVLGVDEGVPNRDEAEVAAADEPGTNGDGVEPNPEGAGEAEEVVAVVADSVKLKRVEEAELGFSEKAKRDDEEEALKGDATAAVEEDVVVVLLDPTENEKRDIFALSLSLTSPLFFL